MALARVQQLTCSPPLAPGLHARTHTRLNLSHDRAPLTASSARPACAGHADRLVRLGLASDSAPDQQHPRADRSRFTLDHIT